MQAWLLLMLAILGEIVATSCLKATDGLTRWLPIVGVVSGYGLAFVLLARTMKVLPVGIIYAVWSGVGTIAIALIGLIIFRESLPPIAWAGIALVIAGCVMLNLAAPNLH
jgi:small multidrug resistance pump